MLEALEERTLLSASGMNPLVPAPLMAMGQYVAQESRNYLADYASTLAAARGMFVNLEQQAILAVSRMEASVQRTVEQFLQEALFPNTTEAGSSAQTAQTPPRHSGGQASNQAAPQSVQTQELSATPVGEAVPTSEAVPAGGPGQPSGFSPSQIRQAYGFNQITFDNGTVKGDGSGQTIAIVDAYNQPNIASDLQTFDSTYGIAAPPSFTVVNQTGGSTLPGLAPSNWALEINIDVEWAHAMAPGANIVLVEANSDYLSDFMPAVNYARNLAGVSVVSMSWGGSEGNAYNYASGNLSSLDSDFTTPSGHNGVTFVASTGDSGTTGNEPEYPSTSPNVLAVGGTVLTTDSAGDYQSETGWTYSGGGISAYESQPSYQKGVVTQNSTMRTVPDVAYNSGDKTGTSDYAVYDTSGGWNGWLTAWGTSEGAPQWAALIAIADQGRALNGAGTLDGPTQTLPAIYQMPQSNFHDITTGSNGAYSAGPGYDLVTGRGTPIANLVVNSLVDYGSYWQKVDLSSDYNRDGLTWGGSPITGGGIDGNNNALEGYYNFNWQGATIPLGPVNAPDVVAAEGQTINLQAGQYSTLTLFATAVNSGNQANQNFTVNYSSGPSQTFTRSFTNWLSAPGGYSDEMKAMQTNAFNSQGAGIGNAYFSAYALPLDPSRTVTSITLPNDSNIVVLAMALYHDGITAQTAGLSSNYNRNGLTWGGTTITGGGIDGNNNALEGYYHFNWQGTSVPLGPVNASDVVAAEGQTINLPAGPYSTLTLFATAVNSGNQANQNFTVNYSSGPSQTFTRSFTNWLTAPGGYSDELRTLETNAFNSNGSVKGNAYFSAYALPLDPSRTVTSITLPNDSNIVVLAMELN